MSIEVVPSVDAGNPMALACPMADQPSAVRAMNPLPEDVDRTRWHPAEDRKGVPVQPGDMVSSPLYPRGTIRGKLAVSDRSWTVMGGSKIQTLVIVTEDGKSYSASSKILKLSEGAKSKMRKTKADNPSDRREGPVTRLYIGSDDCEIQRFVIRHGRTVTTESYAVPIFVTDSLEFARLHAGYTGCVYEVDVRLGRNFEGRLIFDSGAARYWPPEPESFTDIGRDVASRIQSGEIFPGEVDSEEDVYALFASLAADRWDAVEHPSFLRWLSASGYNSARIRGEHPGNHFAVLGEDRVAIAKKTPVDDVESIKRRLLR